MLLTFQCVKNCRENCVGALESALNFWTDSELAV